MTEQALLNFIQQVLRHSATQAKARLTLSQLRSTLEIQGVNSKMLSLIQTTVDSLPESLELAKSSASYTKEELEIAKRRAAERRAREEAARHYSRCC